MNHPQEQANGIHTVNETFPYSGKYFVFSDIKSTGATASVDKQEIEVAGNKPIKPGTTTKKWTLKADGYTVKLIDGNDFKTNRPQQFDFSIEKDGKQFSAKELQPYLGAVPHIIVIGKADKSFLHVHPSSTEKYPVHGEARFDKSGVYRMWVEFQINGKVHKADFTVNVSEGTERMESKKNGHSGH